tara:strand:- start:755 stop:1168 length:414 start_codon:yes stop_codon:yes gene_type:complete
MIDTDKYEGAKKIVEDAGLIDDNEGHLDGHYRKIADLLAEVSDYIEAYKAGLRRSQTRKLRALRLQTFEYINEVEAFHKMLKEEYEMTHKIPLCPENKDNPKEHNWVMDDWVGHRCVDCGFHWCKPLRPPKWKGDDE